MEQSRDFEHVAERILGRILEVLDNGDRITVQDLSGLLGHLNENGSGVNVYPSSIKGECCEVACFISLSSPTYTKGAGHLKFRKALEKLIQHTQGSCFKRTRKVVLITDSWDVPAVEDWRSNIGMIQKYFGVHLEVYFLSNKTISYPQI